MKKIALLSLLTAIPSQLLMNTFLRLITSLLRQLALCFLFLLDIVMRIEHSLKEGAFFGPARHQKPIPARHIA